MRTAAIIYARVSSVGDRQNTQRQVKDLLEYATYKGYDVVGEFTEHISGAKKNTDRAALQEAINQCRELTAEPDTNVCLLASELSRIGRNAFEVMETI